MELALILSVLVLLAAPLLARLVSRTPALKSALDGFVLITVLGLIALTLLPEALAHGGAIGILIAIFGFSMPWIAEFLFHRAEEMTHRVVLLVAALALVVHAASDGAILAFADGHEHGQFVATGILLHRVGVAIAVWWLLRPVLTTWAGVAVLAALGVMTIVGYLMVMFASWNDIPLVGYWQAFAAGSLLHVVLHPLEDHNTTPSKQTRLAHRLGTGAGLLFLTLLIGAHYLHHAPSEVVMMSAHDTHHVIDLMAVVGRLMAPLLILVLLCTATLKKIYGASLKEIYAALQNVAPWTLALWFAATVVAELLPMDIPAPKGGQVLFGIWLASTSLVLVHTGARAFFSTLLPRFALHKHSHDHSH
ncbi:MAG: hypothetical protein HWE25_11695 [Alphaproteobacteria bacterium]|nr:hypothetical protein [Alphaproteobacteria bacterium]